MGKLRYVHRHKSTSSHALASALVVLLLAVGTDAGGRTAAGTGGRRRRGLLTSNRRSVVEEEEEFDAEGTADEDGDDVAAPRVGGHGGKTGRGKATRSAVHTCTTTNITTTVAYKRSPSGEEVLLYWNRTSLPAVLARHVLPDSRDILFTTFLLDQDKSLSFLMHLFGSLEKLELADNMVAACARHSTCVTAWEAGIAAYLPWHAACPVKKPIWPIMLKWLLARHIISLGYNVFFMDFDVGFKGPFLHYTSKVPHDIMVLSDYRGTDFFEAPNKPAHKRFRCQLSKRYRVHPNACVSTGVFHIVASPSTVAFVTRIFNLSLTGVWEQAAFNELLVYHSLPQPFLFHTRQRLHFELFPTPDFINIKLLSDMRKAPQPKPSQLGQNVTLLHCGYTHSLGEKRFDLEREGVWVEEFEGAAGPLPLADVDLLDINVLELA